MRSVGIIILTGFTLLVLVSEAVFLSTAYATERDVMRSFYDGPCSSEKNALALCELSAKPQVVAITAERIAGVKPAPVPKPSSPNPKKLFASIKANVEHWYGHHTRRDPNAWRVYQTSFKPVGPSRMPGKVHYVKDPLAANKKAKELLEKAPPAIKILAACESTLRHYDETGKVLQGEITPGDIGLLQINSLVHAEDAFKDGFNIFSIYGNIGYAIKLYIEKGTQPWNSSRKRCWDSKIPAHLRVPLRQQV